MSKIKKNLVIVLGSSATALAIVREVSLLKDVLIIVACQEKGAACVSSVVEDYWLCNDLSRIVEKIKNTSHNFNIALMPSSDAFVEWICNNSKELAFYSSFDKCYSTGVALDFLDKDIFSKKVSCVSGMEQPKVSSVSEFENIPLEAQYFPVFIKPKVIHKKRNVIAGKKGIIVENSKQWQSWYESNFKQQKDWLVQEIIKGSEDNILLFVGYVNGENCEVYFTARKLRQYPPGFGSASLSISENNEDIVKLSIALLKSNQYQGVCSGEFKWCSIRQKFVIIEFNPRPALWYLLSTASGKHIVNESIKYLLGLEVMTPLTIEKTVLWKYGLKDFFSKLFYLKNKGFILPAPKVDKYLTKKNYIIVNPIFRLNDLKPMLYEMMVYIKKGLMRVLKK